MAISIQALREAKAKKIQQAKDLHGKDEFTPEDQKAFDALMAEADTLETRIQNEMKLQGLSDPADSDKIAASANAGADQGGVINRVEVKPVYQNLGAQMLDVRSMTLDTSDAPKARERFTQVVNAAGVSTGIDSEGGFLVETDKAKSIMETAIETGVLSRRCARQPISSSADSFSYMAAKDRDRSTGKRNGMQVFRKAEAESMTSSGKAGFEERELRVEDMYGLIYVTNRMLQDAPALAAYSKRILKDQFAFKLDQEIFEGTGAGQCLGIMNSDLPVVVDKEAGQTAKTITAENVVKMLSRFTGNIASAAWFVNQDCLPQLPFLKIGDQPMFVPGGSFANAPFGALFGRPIEPIEFCETLGAKGDIILGDFGEYLLVEKGGLDETESIHVKFLTAETAFRFIARNNGQPMHDTPIKPLKGNSTLSPFVMLADRA